MANVSYERRKHKRHDLACPVRLASDPAEAPTKSKGINLSDGGLLFPLPAQAVPPVGSHVQLGFSVPRSTPNTYLLEDFSSRAVVVRSEPPDGEGAVRVAVQFEGPMNLAIDV